MQVKDGIAELNAVWECSDQFRDTIARRDTVVDQINALVDQHSKLSEQLEDLDTELDERGLVCCTAVQRAATSQYGTVREGVVSIQEAMSKLFPEYMEQAAQQQVEQQVEQEQAALDVPTQQAQPEASTRPDGTVPRRPARPQRPRDVKRSTPLS